MLVHIYVEGKSLIKILSEAFLVKSYLKVDWAEDLARGPFLSMQLKEPFESQTQMLCGSVFSLVPSLAGFTNYHSASV